MDIQLPNTRSRGKNEHGLIFIRRGYSIDIETIPNRRTQFYKIAFLELAQDFRGGTGDGSHQKFEDASRGGD